jgi:hypothetical protein
LRAVAVMVRFLMRLRARTRRAGRAARPRQAAEALKTIEDNSGRIYGQNGAEFQRKLKGDMDYRRASPPPPSATWTNVERHHCPVERHHRPRYRSFATLKAKERIQDPAPADVAAWATTVPENLSIHTTCLFKSIR